ncbi:unnamed protein product [Closterium sp. NIES-53]
MKSSWIKARAALSVPLSTGLHRWTSSSALIMPPHSTAVRFCSPANRPILRLDSSSCALSLASSNTSSHSSSCSLSYDASTRSFSAHRPSLCSRQPVARPRSSHAVSRAGRLAATLTTSFLHPAGAGVAVPPLACRPPKRQLTVASGAASAGQPAVPQQPHRTSTDTSLASGNGSVSEFSTSIHDEVEGSIWQGGKKRRAAVDVEEEVVVEGDGAAAGRGQQSYVELEPTPMVQEAWDLLNASVVHYYNQPVGTVAAADPTSTAALNYDQVFIRDFIPSALAFMLSGHHEIVRNFLLYTLQLQVSSRRARALCL